MSSSLLVSSTDSSTTLGYPLIEPFEQGLLKVSAIHSLYYEISGKKDGLPVVFLHGGPGGASSVTDRTYFDASKYLIILFDQRGAGKSIPKASLEENTTWDLVEDLERLRKHLNVEQWIVFGGSWGSTLALAYAQLHPSAVKGLILRGVFTMRESELAFFYQDGTKHLFPEAWDDFIAPIPESERGDLIKAYHSRLNSDDDTTRLTAARAWSRWELSTSRLQVNPEFIANVAKDDWANAFARIENHYFINEGWMRQGQLLEKEQIDKIRHIPTIVVQGRYDVICPATTAYALKKVWPEISLHITHAGHSAREIENIKKLVEAADALKEL